MDRASTLSRVAAGAIALTAWVGLAVQFDASLRQLGSVVDTLWVMLRYFTVVANLLVAIVFTGVTVGARRCAAPSLTGAVTLAILLVGVVYGLLLRGLVELSAGARLANFLLHGATPVLVGLFWLALAPKGGLRRRDPWMWSAIPVVYFAYALARGAIEGIYAYPFMNVTRIGWAQTAVNALAMALGFLVAGLAMVWLDHRLGRRAKKG